MGGDDEVRQTKKAHPIVRLFTGIGWLITSGKQRRKDRARQRAEEERLAEENGEVVKKKPGLIGRLFGKKKKKNNDDEDSDEEDDAQDAQDDEEDWDGNVSDDGDGESEDWDPDVDDGDEDDYYEEDVDFTFRPGQPVHPFEEREPIERLGPEDLRELQETLAKMQPKYKKAEDQIPDGEIEQMVKNRMARLRKANKFNAVIAFGESRQIPITQGRIRIPTLITVTGHNGAGGNLGINGVYERFPDNHHGRPVYQKYLDRHEYINEPQVVQFSNGAKAWVSHDLDDEHNGRTFPTIHDSPRTALAMKHTMVAVKVLPPRKDPHAVGDFTLVHKSEAWFIYFDDLMAAWCIGPKPGSNSVFARCYGVDESIPDGLGPDRWEVFDVGMRTWSTHRTLRTLKGGTVSSAK